MLEGRSGVKVDVGPSVVERKVFEIGELFDLILQYVVEALYAVIASELGVEVEEGKEEEAEEEEEGEEQVDDTNAQGDNEGDNNNDASNASNSEKSTSRITDPPSALTSLRTLLSLAQVDHWFYHALPASTSSPNSCATLVSAGCCPSSQPISLAIGKAGGGGVGGDG